ncbi:hypothetical protein Bca4012_064839 [Brassica carinata]
MLRSIALSSSKTAVILSGRNYSRRLSTPTTTLRCISSHASSDLVSEHPPFVRIYKDGRVERLAGTETVPASLTPQNGVVTKDVVYSSEHNLSVRLFLPHESTAGNNKLPLLIYIHGGAWLIGSPFTTTSSRRSSKPRTAWPCRFSTASRLRIRSPRRTRIHGPRFSGSSHIQTAFWGKDPIDELDMQAGEARRRVAEVWEKLVSPNSVDGADDPWFNVVGSGSDLSGLGCEKVLVAVAGRDVFVRQGLGYAEKLKKSGWRGDVEVMEEGDEDHCFHLLNPSSENAPRFMNKFVEFITG